jgi:UDP-N-acetylmuramoyl-L-alanyl-D-glutamate--2,6-diaminopimelate ligase
LGSVLGARIIGDPQVEILGLAYDSRRVEPGSAFICVRGERTVTGRD